MQNGHLYCDARSREALAGGGNQVLLLGGYGGYANFGDILQLKGVIRWHRAHTGLKPVLVCFLDSGPDAEFSARLRRWFGVEAVLFAGGDSAEAAQFELAALSDAPKIPWLHVYGGGFLNSYWACVFLPMIERIQDSFSVEHYALSGQQIDPGIVPELTRHFAEYPPVMAGARDRASIEILSRCGAPADYSFDDALEPLLELVKESKCAARPGRMDAWIHLNASHYSLENEGGKWTPHVAAMMDKLQAHLAKIGGKPSSVGVLHAYDDGRAEIVDSLGVVQQLGGAFPFSEYTVVHLAQLATKLWVAGEPQLDRSLDASLAIASSYHVALFTSLLGIPCYLRAHNSYYQQKLAGLGLVDSGLEQFLLNPTVPVLDEPQMAREQWLRKLAGIFRNPPVLPRPKKKTPAVANGSDAATPAPAIPAVAVEQVKQPVAAPAQDPAASQPSKQPASAGQLDEPYLAIHRALKSDPIHLDVLRELANVAFHRGLHEESAELYRWIHQRAPGDLDSLLGQAKCSLKRGHHVLAKILFEEALMLQPKNGEHKNGAGFQPPAPATPPATSAKPVLNQAKKPSPVIAPIQETAGN